MSKNRQRVNLAAIDPFIVQNIILPTESTSCGSDWVSWGQGNGYPDYLLNLYDNVTTLHSIINGNVDFIAGDEITIEPLSMSLQDGAMNHRGDSIREQIRDIAKDYQLYGGFALQVIRNAIGEVAEVYYLDMRFIRANKECDVFYYSEKWSKSGRKDAIIYPAFIPISKEKWAQMEDTERARMASSVLFVKNNHTKVYPTPLYAAAVKACEIERAIDDYHLNSIENGFASSAIINFNNGVPDDEIKAEIETAFMEKFTGSQNAGRVLFSWNENKDSATTIDMPNVQDFGDKYKALANHSRQQIFTSFRANPNLFGIPTENNGFSNEEYEESFRLYNRTQIKPAQRLIVNAYEKIYGKKDILQIVPFSLDGIDKVVK